LELLTKVALRLILSESGQGKKIMNKTIFLVGVALISGSLVCGRVEAQVAPQTVEVAKVDITKLAAGYRASKVIGSSVVNDSNETIGTIDDLLVSPDGKDPFAVLSVGGFLGMGSHLVVVPYDNLRVVDKKLMLPGGTKDGLKMLPEFKYATE
jgi:PRC-barrel domain